MTEKTRLGYTVKEAAELLGASSGVVRNAIKEGRLHAVKLGKRKGTIIPAAALSRYLYSGMGPIGGTTSCEENTSNTCMQQMDARGGKVG